MSKSKILFIFTGSIACYKAVNVVSKLVQEGHQVQCILTSAAAKFIGRATLEGLTNQKAHSDLFEEGSIMGHIKLIRDADLIVVAPATANFVNKIASGIADDLASTLFLAHDFKKPFVLVPAMNSTMYAHPITQKSLAYLSQLGVVVTQTGSGILACGEIGYGKLLEPDLILNEIHKVLIEKPARIAKQENPEFKSKKIIITGGGTVEKIDSVRSITNTSTGATSVKMAEFFSELGFEVTLLLAKAYPYEIASTINVQRFSSFSDLNSTLKTELEKNRYDFIFHAAAVSDFSVKEIKLQGKKIKANSKIDSNKELSLVLKPNIKIISKIKQYSVNKNIHIIGFKLTNLKSDKEKLKAVEKLFVHNNVEFVIHNDLSDLAEDKSQHRFTLYDKSGKKHPPITGLSELNSVIISEILLGGDQ